MTHEIDGISEAIGQQRAQIAGLKETMVLNHSAMDKKLDKIVEHLDKLNGRVAKNENRLNDIEPEIADYKLGKKRALYALLGLGAIGGAGGTSLIAAVKGFLGVAP